MLLKYLKKRTPEILKFILNFVLLRPRILHFTAYIAFIGVLNLGLQILPDRHFGVTLTTLICLAVTGSILLIWPRPMALLTGAAGALVMTLLLEEVNRQKAVVTAFPITTTDLKMFAANPSGLLMAIGAPPWSFAAIYVIPLGLAAYLAWSTRRRLKAFGLMGVLARTTAFGISVLTAGVSLFFLNASVVGAVTSYVTVHMQELSIWEPEGMVDFPERVGILGFLSYSQYIEAGERDHFLTYSPQADPPPPAEIEASVRKYVQTEKMQPGLLPNIVIVHAESTFDPNDVLNLASPAANTLFYTYPGTPDDPMVHVRGPALANTIGGGSWISEFEVILGIDSRLFGVAGRFTHASLSQFARQTFPRYLQARGYDVSAYQTSDGSFYNSERAYMNYGFDYFFDDDYFEPTSNDLVIMKSALLQEAGDPAAPFMKFVILAENHSPHWCDPTASSSYEAVELSGDPTEEQACAVREYLRRAHSTEGAVAFARSYLEAEKARTGRDYVIAVYGDHQPYSFTGGGVLEHNMGLDFSSFRHDQSKRRTILQIISSKPNPLKCCGDEAVPLTLLPTLVSSYVAGSASEIYLPESFYQLDRCGSDWIGRLVGTTFYGRDNKVDEARCDRFEELIAAYKASDVLGNPETPLFESGEHEQTPPAQAQPQIDSACLKRPGNLPIEVVASGTRFGEAPKFRVLLDGMVVGEASVAQAPDNSESPVEVDDVLNARALFEFAAVGTAQPKTLSIQFVNDSWAGTGFSGDTDLWIQSVKVGNRLFPSGELQFLSGGDMRGEWVGDWFRFATNGALTANLSENLCG